MTTWMDRAACKGQTEKFFAPLGMKKARKEFLDEARAICARCPVREECLSYALEFSPVEMHGLWGGLEGRELAREGRRRGVTYSRPTIQSIFDARDVKMERKLVDGLDKFI